MGLTGIQLMQQSLMCGCSDLTLAKLQCYKFFDVISNYVGSEI